MYRFNLRFMLKCRFPSKDSLIVFDVKAQKAISISFRFRAMAPGAAFTQKLHLIYLINDLLHYWLVSMLFQLCWMGVQRVGGSESSQRHFVQFTSKRLTFCLSAWGRMRMTWRIPSRASLSQCFAKPPSVSLLRLKLLIYWNLIIILGANEDQKEKLNKLLTLWESKSNFFDSCAISKLQSPPSSLQEYQNTLLSQYASTLTPLSQTTKAKFDV